MAPYHVYIFSVCAQWPQMCKACLRLCSTMKDCLPRSRRLYPHQDPLLQNPPKLLEAMLRDARIFFLPPLTFSNSLAYR